MINKEIRSLTGIRGVASLYVCLYHFYQWFANNNKDSLFVKNEYFFVFASHGYIAVDLFFMLSAFVLTLSSAQFFDYKLKFSNYKVFMQRRFIRIYPSYFFIVVITYIFIYQYNHTILFLCSLTLLNILIGAPYMLANHWSLGVEWITYIVFPAFYKLSVLIKHNWWTYMLIFYGMLTLFIVGIASPDYKSFNYLLNISSGYYGILRCFGCYLLGMAAFKVFKNLKTAIFYKNIFSIIITISIIISLFFAKADLVTELLFMLLLISIARDNNLVAKILSSKIIYFLGVISYPLYLIHFVICLNIWKIYSFFKTEKIGIHSNLSLFFLYITLCILLSTVFTYCIELPVIKYLNIVSKKKDKKFGKETMILDESKLKI